MTDRRTLSSSLSAKVIQYLRRRGHKQSEIARMLHVSDGYVSLVKSKERSLTIDHLELLSLALGVPLGAMLIAVTRPPTRGKYDKQLFAITEKIMRQADIAREQILRASGTRSRRSA